MVSFSLFPVNVNSPCLKPMMVFDFAKADWVGVDNYLMDCGLELCYESEDVEEISGVS